MTSKPKISIIIPVYNREKLLPETLNSIILQSFINWECILVDDQSTDDSYGVMQQYQRKDQRFKIFKRPPNLKKGANACRNYGFLQASGSYIKWFDSDDIMLSKHLETAYHILVEKKLDFVITDTINFSHEKRKILGRPYEFDKNTIEISAQNMALEKIGWITDDFLGTRVIVQNIKFNENITTDGDEYNFFVRLLNQPFNGMFIEEIMTHRRIHNASLTNIYGENTIHYLTKIAIIKYQTAQDLVEYNNKELIRWFLSGYMQFTYKLALKRQTIPYCFKGFKLICRYYSVFKGIAFLLALQTAKYFKKGFNVMKYARK